VYALDGRQLVELGAAGEAVGQGRGSSRTTGVSRSPFLPLLLGSIPTRLATRPQPAPLSSRDYHGYRFLLHIRSLTHLISGLVDN
jgi:hypothetical protein